MDRRKRQCLAGGPWAMNPRQELFVREFLSDANATRAAIKAGYSEHTAKQIGSRLLTNVEVQAAIQRAREEAHAAAGITAQKIAEELGKVGFASIAQICSWDAEGHVTMLASAEI